MGAIPYYSITLYQTHPRSKAIAGGDEDLFVHAELKHWWRAIHPPATPSKKSFHDGALHVVEMKGAGPFRLQCCYDPRK